MSWVEILLLKAELYSIQESYSSVVRVRGWVTKLPGFYQPSKFLHSPCATFYHVSAQFHTEIYFN